MQLNIKSDYKSKQSQNHFKRKEKILGQFFTPYNVADFIISYSEKFLRKREIICDPACGDGVFLSAAHGKSFKKVIGIDIDESVKKSLPSKIVKDIIVKNGLHDLDLENKADLVVGNPPFSAKYGKVIDQHLLNNFQLGKGRKSQAIEILFLEKFFKLANENGLIGIILPMGIFANMQLFYVRNFILKNLKVLAIISLPRSIFRSSGKKTTSKTCILMAQKSRSVRPPRILMVKVNDPCDLFNTDKLGKLVEIEDNMLYPEYYFNKLELKTNINLGDLVDIKNGATEYGDKRFFANNGIPFISAKIVTPLGIDFSKKRKYIRPNSIMDKKRAYVDLENLVFVRVGIACIGRVAVITHKAEQGIADDWIYILRFKDSKISPYYLAFYLQTPSIQSEIRRLSRGVGTITIPIRFLRKIPVLTPDVNLSKEAKSTYLKIVTLRGKNQYKEAKHLYEAFIKRLDSFIKQSVSW